jgi:Ca2+-binding EF-hand superfamily protein
MKKIVFPAVAVVALIAAMPAFAEGGPKGDRGAMMLEQFDAIDADKDGKVTEAEIAAFRAARFVAADADKNGQLSAEELTAMHQGDAQGRMAKRSARMIEHLDTNADGLLSAEEFAEMGQRKSPFERADTDNDGAVTLAELQAAKEAHDGKGRGHGKGHGWWGIGGN